MNCKNCKNRVDGNFCSNCGQNSNVNRINFSNFINELLESVFQINRGFFFTLRELFVRPGNSLNEYLNGKRKSHFKPLAYLLTLSTLYFLITQITNQNTWIDDLITGWMNGATGQNPESEIPESEMPEMAKWFASNYAYTTILLLPVFSLASYFSFSKFGKNYLEHIVLNSYVTGHQAIIYSFFAITGTFIKTDVIEGVSIAVGVLYTFWVFKQFFSGDKLMLNILRTIMTYMLYWIFSLGLLIILAGMNEL